MAIEPLPYINCIAVHGARIATLFQISIDVWFETWIDACLRLACELDWELD